MPSTTLSVCESMKSPSHRKIMKASPKRKRAATALDNHFPHVNGRRLCVFSSMGATWQRYKLCSRRETSAGKEGARAMMRRLFFDSRTATLEEARA